MDGGYYNVKGIDLMIHDTALIYDNVFYGKNFEVDEFVSLGSQPYVYNRVDILLPRWERIIATKGVIIGDDVKIHSYTRIENGVNRPTVLKDRVRLASRVTIGHDSIIGEGCMIHPDASIWGNVIIGRGSYIGGCACIMQGIKIGKDVVIGMNSTVTKDIPDNSLAYNATKEGDSIYCRVVGKTRNRLKSLIRRNLI